MMSTCLSAVCVVGIVTIGILIMTGIISPEQVMNATGRAFLLIAAVLLTLCMLKGILIAAVTAALVWLKLLIFWLAIIALVLGSVVLISRIAISKFEEWSPGRGDHHRG